MNVRRQHRRQMSLRNAAPRGGFLSHPSNRRSIFVPRFAQNLNHVLSRRVLLADRRRWPRAKYPRQRPLRNQRLQDPRTQAFSSNNARIMTQNNTARLRIFAGRGRRTKKHRLKPDSSQGMATLAAKRAGDCRRETKRRAIYSIGCQLIQS